MATRNRYKYFGDYHLALRGMFGRLSAGAPLPTLVRAIGSAASTVWRAVVAVRRAKGEVKRLGD